MPALRQRILDDMDADTRTAIEDLLRAELDGSAGTGSEREEMPPVTGA